MSVPKNWIIAHLTVIVLTPLVAMSVPVIVGIWMKDLDMCVQVCNICTVHFV